MRYALRYVAPVSQSLIAFRAEEVRGIKQRSEKMDIAQRQEEIVSAISSTVSPSLAAWVRREFERGQSIEQVAAFFETARQSFRT